MSTGLPHLPFTAAAALIALIVLPAGPAHAEFADGDVIKYTLGAGVAYDNNIFRLPAGARADPSTGSTARGDTIFTLNAGATANKDISRQNVLLNANVTQGIYAQHSSFDYTLFNFGGIWNWLIGSKLGGQIGFAQVQYPNYFTDIRSFQQNIRTVQTPFASAGYRFHPDWEFRLRYEYGNVTNDLPSRKITNVEENRYLGGVRYRTQTGNLADLYYQYTSGTRPNLPEPPQFSQSFRDYTGNEFGVNVGRWQFSAQSQFTGFLSYTTRNYTFAPSRNFSGPTFNLMYSWLPTSRTAVNISAYRLIGLYADVTTSYIVTTGVTVNPTWRATEKLNFGVRAYYDNRNYAGQPDAILGLVGVEKRNDDIMSAGVNATYAFLRTVDGTLYYTWTRRNSNRPELDFNDSTVGVGLQWTF